MPELKLFSIKSTGVRVGDEIMILSHHLAGGKRLGDRWLKVTGVSCGPKYIRIRSDDGELVVGRTPEGIVFVRREVPTRDEQIAKYEALLADYVEEARGAGDKALAKFNADVAKNGLSYALKWGAEELAKAARKSEIAARIIAHTTDDRPMWQTVLATAEGVKDELLGYATDTASGRGNDVVRSMSDADREFLRSHIVATATIIKDLVDEDGE